MVKIVKEKETTVKLQRGNKIIERTFKQYQDNKAKWDFRGFKVVSDDVKEVKVIVEETKIEQPKKKKVIRKKKDEQVDLAKN